MTGHLLSCCGHHSWDRDDCYFTMISKTVSENDKSNNQYVAFMLGRVRIFETPWTVAHQAPLSMKSSRQEYQSGLPFPPPVDLPNPGIKPSSPASPALQADSLPLSHQRSPASMLAGEK